MGGLSVAPYVFAATGERVMELVSRTPRFPFREKGIHGQRHGVVFQRRCLGSHKQRLGEDARPRQSRGFRIGRGNLSEERNAWWRTQ